MLIDRVSTQRCVSGGLCTSDVDGSFGSESALTAMAGVEVPFGIGVD